MRTLRVEDNNLVWIRFFILPGTRDAAVAMLCPAKDEDEMGNATNFKCVAVLAFALAGCFPNAIEESTNDSKAEYAEIGGSFILSENKIAALEEASANGDSEASYDLFLHYTFSDRTAENEEKADFWLSKAAGQGYEKAKALQEKTKARQEKKRAEGKVR